MKLLPNNNRQHRHISVCDLSYPFPYRLYGFLPTLNFGHLPFAQGAPTPPTGLVYVSTRIWVIYANFICCAMEVTTNHRRGPFGVKEALAESVPASWPSRGVETFRCENRRGIRGVRDKGGLHVDEWMHRPWRHARRSKRCPSIWSRIVVINNTGALRASSYLSGYPQVL